jgi:hypothetical protein
VSVMCVCFAVIISGSVSIIVSLLSKDTAGGGFIHSCCGISKVMTLMSLNALIIPNESHCFESCWNDVSLV